MSNSPPTAAQRDAPGSLEPLSRVFGFDRGQCIDRYYIERFLARHAAKVRGRVLEIGDDEYIRKFGGRRVTQADILHLQGTRKTTIVADLTHGKGIGSDTFDCIICTQTLPFIYDVRAAVQTLYRVLRPGGVLLVTAAGISQISRFDMERWGDYWRFTTCSMRRLLEEAFPDTNLHVNAHGNVLVAAAFLRGMATRELKPEELDHNDPDYQLIITATATKPGDVK